MRLIGASKVQRADVQQQQQQGQATKANLKAWWNQFNFVKGIKKEAREDGEFFCDLQFLEVCILAPEQRRALYQRPSPSG